MRKFRDSEQPEHIAIAEESAFPVDLYAEMIADAGRAIPPDGAEIDLDPLDGLAFGPKLIEQLLYGIILAHPSPSKVGHKAHLTDRQRLEAAMMALFGTKLSRNPLPGDADDKALLWMKAEQKRVKRSKSKISDRSLAIQAAELFFPGFDKNNDMSAANRLREKFSGAYYKKQDKGSRAEIPTTLEYRAFQHDYVVESLERKILLRIIGNLSMVGVAVTLPD